MSGYITSPTIQDNVNEQSNIIDSLGKNTKLTDLNVIAYAYRTNGTLKWVDILDAQGNITRCNCVTVEDIIYIDWHGQYVWTDINCKTLQVGGELFEEVVDDIEYLKNKEMIVDLTSTSPASLGDDSDPAKIGIEIPTETVPITVGLAENADGILVESETNNEIDVVGSLTNEVAPFKHLKKSSLVFNPSTKTLFNGEEYFLTQSQSARYLTSDSQGNPFSSLVSLQTDDKYYNGSITAAGLNDYAIVLDQINNTAQRYVFTGSQWAFQYNINTTTFSSDQWNAINSMATENKIERSLLSVCEIQQGATANSIELHDINGNIYTEPPFDNIQLVCYSQINITGGALKWGSFDVRNVNGNNVTTINKGTVFCLTYSTLNGVRLYKEHFLNGDRVLVSNNNNASGMSESNITDTELSALSNIRSNIQQQFDRGFTFVVCDTTTWNDFVNQTSGNDYSRTLITAGEYTLNIQVVLPNNILVQGETGTIINIGVPNTEIFMQEGTSKTATIKNITFNNSFPTSLSNYRMFRCITLKDCIFNFSGSIAGGTSAGQNGGYFYNCIVENCTITQTGLFRIIDCRWGDVKGSIFRNCTFKISNSQSLTSPFGVVDNGNGLIFMDCQFFFAYTLTANSSTPVFIQGGKNASLINCYFYINNAGGHTLTFNFGNCNILNSVINYDGAITFSKASTALTSGVIGNTSFILT